MSPEVSTQVEEYKKAKKQENKKANMNDYQKRLKGLMDEYVHYVYKLTKKFPREEIYGLVSQLRRSAISIILNYIEGYARRRTLVRFNMLETSYGSFQETKYIVQFSLIEGYISKEDYLNIELLEKEIGAMLWTELTKLEGSIKAVK